MKKIYMLLLFNLSVFTGLKAQWLPDCVQLVHNSADAALPNVKVWVNDTVWVTNLAFQQATARATFVAGTHTMGISTLTATAQSQCVIQQTFSVGSGIDNQFLLINGLTGNATNPLAIHSYTEGIMGQPSPFQGFVSFYNGCTAYNMLSLVFTPSLSLSGQQPLNITGLAYPQLAVRDVDIASPSSGNNNTYTISVNSGTAGLGSFLFPSSAYAGKVVRVVMNSSYNIVPKGAGIGFGLVIVPANGGTVTPVTKIVAAVPTGVNAATTDALQLMVFPNPVKDVLQLGPGNASAKSFNLEITDITGKIVMELKDFYAVDNKIHVGHLDKGVYLLTLMQGQERKTIKFVKD